MNTSTAVETYQEPAPLKAMTPMDMLQAAVTRGADMSVLEKLMALQERWSASQARRAFDEAMAAAKAEIPPITRNKTGNNNKRYADFAALARVVDPIISRHGLSYRFRTVQDERIHVTCVLSHRSGHSEENTLSGPADTTGNKNAIQAIGSTLTYLQRYSLMQALGLAASDDDDAAAIGTEGAISDEQVDAIRGLIVETGADIPRFVAYMGVDRIEDIPAKAFGRAVSALEKKRSAA